MNNKARNLPIALAFLAVFLVVTVPDPLAGAFSVPGTETRSPNTSLAFEHASRTLNWTPDVVPSTRSNVMRSTFTGLASGDGVALQAGSAILEANMTLDNITINAIHHPVETFVHDAQPVNPILTTSFYQEISVPASCYLPWVSIYIQYMHPNVEANNWTLAILNSVQDAASPFSHPGTAIPGSTVSFNPALDQYPHTNINYNKPHWKNVTVPDVYLNTSNTYRFDGFYRFYIRVTMPTFNGQHLYWFFNNHTETGGVPSGRSFRSVLGFIGEMPDVDFTLITSLVPESMMPLPSAINLAVNNEPVQDVSPGSGTIHSQETFLARDNEVQYDITSAWSQFPGGKMTYDLDVVYVESVEVVPLVQVKIERGDPVISWRVLYEVSFDPEPGFPGVRLHSALPRSWQVDRFVNVSGDSETNVSHVIMPAPTGKYNQFVVDDLAPGTYLLECHSSLGDMEVATNLVDGSIELDRAFEANVTLVGGPNGLPVSLFSDHEGSVAGFEILEGRANDTHARRMQFLDGKGIQFSNDAHIDLLTLLLSLGNALETNVRNVSVNSTFDLQLDVPEGFDQSNIEDIEIVLNHDAFNRSAMIANFTVVDVPENPAWNVGNLPADQYLWRGLFFDNNTIPVNLTYNMSEARHADIHLAHTARVLENGSIVERERIVEIVLDTVVSFNKTIYNQELFVKNQSSGLFVKMNGTTLLEDAGDHLHLQWNSSNEQQPFNASDFIRPGDHLVEFFLRTENVTGIDMTPLDASIGKVHHIDVALCTFTYTNTFHAFTVQVFNWTSGSFSNHTIYLPPAEGKTESRVSLQSLAVDLPDFFDADSNLVRLLINASSIVPIYNTITWTIERVMVNLTYTNVMPFAWQETILADGERAVFTSARETLFDSIGNNLSTLVPVSSFLNFTDDYVHELLWTNFSDISIITMPFIVNREDVLLTIHDDVDEDFSRELQPVTLTAHVTIARTGEPLANKTIVFFMSIVHRSGEITVQEVRGVAGVDGVATVTVEVGEGWRSFYHVAEFVSDDPIFRHAMSDRSPTYEVLDTAGFVLMVLGANTINILIAGALVAGALIIRSRVQKRRKMAWRDRAGKIKDVLKIRHLFVIMKLSGTCVVDRSYASTKLDADLVSGFLTAIASFGSEVGHAGKQPRAQKGDALLFDYRSFKILLVDGEHARGALILDGNPTPNLKERLAALVESFENAYPLAGWKGNLSIFSTVDALIEEAFEISLLYPLLVDPVRPRDAIDSRLGKALHGMATALQAKQGSFQLANLVDIATAARGEPDERVLSAIHALKRDGFLVPVSQP